MHDVNFYFANSREEPEQSIIIIYRHSRRQKVFPLIPLLHLFIFISPFGLLKNEALLFLCLDCKSASTLLYQEKVDSDLNESESDQRTRGPLHQHQAPLENEEVSFLCQLPYPKKTRDTIYSR
jgi:hypothetical protein